MTVNWLHAYLIQAIRMNLCMKNVCTTCGATEFREGLANAVNSAMGRDPQQPLDRESGIEIARALAGISPNGNVRRPLDRAVRFIILNILWNRLCLRDKEWERLLDGSWAGATLHGMKEHYEARETSRRAEEASLHARREEKKHLKQEQHSNRLALKKERDRLWRDQHGKAD